MQPVLSRDRVENSLSYGYFEMIGTLSRHHEGVKWVCVWSTVNDRLTNTQAAGEVQVLHMFLPLERAAESGRHHPHHHRVLRLYKVST